MTYLRRRLVHLRRFLSTSSCKTQFSSSQAKLLSHLEHTSIKNYLDKMENSITSNQHELHSVIPRAVWCNLYSIRKQLIANLDDLKVLKSDEKSTDLSDMISEEESKYAKELQDVELNLLKSFAPGNEEADEIIVEVTPGVGGKEAAIFAKELCDMYCNYAYFKRWNSIVDHMETSEVDGIRQGRIYIEGSGAMRYLIHESGVHRVQRVPATEKSGRIHTSTAAVAVLPQVSLREIQIAEKDLSIETMRATGAGGQHVNRTDSAVRMTHIPSGIVVECQEDRSQIRNRQTALQKLKFRLNEHQQREHDDKIRGSRKSQVGTSARSDKVRTYNFPQDRITDHRLSQNIHNVPNFFKGNNVLDATIEKLILLSNEERLDKFVAFIKENY